jgi:hypothetical protein
MSSNKSPLVLVILPILAVGIAIIITAIAIWYKYRRAHPLLPTTERPPTPLFTERHIASIRKWRKPDQPAAPPMDEPWLKLKTDPNHLQFPAAPAPSHQPERPMKGNWQKFKEKQALREEQAKMPQVPLEKCQHQPMGPTYWRQYGVQMRMEPTWWEKLKEKVGL